MISNIFIRNFAIVDQLELDFTKGMTAFTGETGAGKSILLDAIGLILGDRADTDTVRHGTDKAEVICTFDISAITPVKEWLEDNDLLADEDECTIRRIISSEGRSKSYINGSPAPLQSLKQLGEMLVNIHGQHEHQSLTKKITQREILDEYAQNQSLLEEISTLFKDFTATKAKLDELKQNNQSTLERVDYLRFQINQFESLALEENEYSRLSEEHKVLANAGNISATGQQVAQILNENEQFNVNDGLNQAISLISSIGIEDKKLDAICELLSSAQIQADEAFGELSSYIDNIDLDPGRLVFVEDRIAAILDMARKHQSEPIELLKKLSALNEELESLENSEQITEDLENRLIELQNKYDQVAQKLTASRAKAAKDLSKQISASMNELGMSDGIFDIALSASQTTEPQKFGTDTIEYLVSANKGQPLKALGKIASGGELSRISLALQVAAANSIKIPTMIFDEVDTGIGGGIAQVVGNKLRQLADSRQVFCVTHLPQVASSAHQHLRVQKSIENENTKTDINLLDTEKRIDEIARMLGGVNITENTLNHAKEMIAEGSG
ncbi:MAG: DNA repair protein RecN [Gammaproteobacteria bacterium]|nr:MAG: DNA repair protein RecN [Gammaproteobacteria bacterium]